jgi:hypothetical protein
MINKDFIIGGDPEFFCKDIKTNQYISLIPYIEGTKKNPEDIEIKGCSQLRDGVSIELNLPPMPEFWMLHRIISDCIDYTNKWLQDINPDYKLDITSSAFFDDTQLKHKEARTFGCDPAYSCYKWMHEVPRPEPSHLNGLRTASYHIHYGWEEEIHCDMLRYFIFLNDVFLGFPALYLDSTDELRKGVYGELGEHRIKKNKTSYYNIEKSNRVEYRVLGAGIHDFPGFIENGIKLIRDNVENLSEFVELYYEDFKKLHSEFENLELREQIKNKLIKNGHYNR